MTKIRPVLFWLLFFTPFFDFGQTANHARSASSPNQSGSMIGYSGRQAAFTFHPLADWVEPEKKQPYERLSKGRPVSLPCPIPRQQTQRPC